MIKKTPVQEKTPFAIHSTPLTGAITSQAGLCVVSRAFRSLGLPALADAQVRFKKRSRGVTAGEHVESLVLLHAAGGDCMDDMERLRVDAGIGKMLGFQPPSPSCMRAFLETFHEGEAVSRARMVAQSRGRQAFLVEENGYLSGLGAVLAASVGAVTRRVETGVRATVDQDATIIESAKAEAQWTYEGSRGYQPMVAVWAETSLVLADEFRDGNVPAQMEPLACAKAAFAALPDTVNERYFRGDSACHEHGLVIWLRDENRADGPKGFIGFAVSARLSVELAQALRAVPETHWTTFGKDRDGTLRQWAEVDFVPGERVEKKDIQPLRYIGLRLLKPQGELFADGNDRHYHALLTNRTEEDGGMLLTWHREKAGTVEHVHDELKNGLGAGQLPSGKFGANAAWFRIACIAHNVLTAVRLLCPDESLKTAKAKRLRFEMFNVTGRLSRDRRKITLRFVATAEWIQRILKLFMRFPLRTQSTG